MLFYLLIIFCIAMVSVVSYTIALLWKNKTPSPHILEFLFVSKLYLRCKCLSFSHTQTQTHTHTQFLIASALVIKQSEIHWVYCSLICDGSILPAVFSCPGITPTENLQHLEDKGGSDSGSNRSSEPVKTWATQRLVTSLLFSKCFSIQYNL